MPWIFYPPIALDMMVWGLFAVALDICFGVAGMTSFGHALYWGASGFIAGNIALRVGVPFPLVVLFSALVVAVLAVPVAWLAVRRVGFYFAMVTLAFAQVGFFIATQASGYTGGENGLQRIPRHYFGAEVSDSFTMYYAALPLIALGFLLTAVVRHSPFGRVLEAIRDDPVRTQAIGYPVNGYRIVTFVFSAFIAGIAGSIFALGHQFTSLETLSVHTSGLVLIMVVLGGMRSQWGPVIGAMIIVFLEDYFATSYFEYANTVIGLILIVVVLFFRKGIWGAVRSVENRLRRRSRTGGAAAPDPDESPGEPDESSRPIEAISERNAQ
jgi:branched-chain amino acid transport system permease protein